MGVTGIVKVFMHNEGLFFYSYTTNIIIVKIAYLTLDGVALGQFIYIPFCSFFMAL